MVEVTCKRCGRVAFAVTRAYAAEEVTKFNSYYKTLSVGSQADYGGLSTITSYERCVGCGGSYKDFRVAQEGDCPDGSTLSAILHFEE